MSDIGAHLLGRIPSTPDARDFKLAHFLTGDPLDAALAAVLSSRANSKVKAWIQIATPRIQAISPAPTPAPTPTPTPTPTPSPAPSDSVIWTNTDPTLDQGNTGHCVGFGWTGGWGDTLPIDDHYVNTDGHALYYEAKVIDGEPGKENGSSVRSGAKAMQNRKKLSAYAFTSKLAEAKAWIRTKGPLVFGIDWTQDMFTPDTNGFISPTGTYAGGHCIACVGDIPSESALLFQNSWGPTWGDNGRFKIKYADVATLMAGLDPTYPGEVCASVEL